MVQRKMELRDRVKDGEVDDRGDLKLVPCSKKSKAEDGSSRAHAACFEALINAGADEILFLCQMGTIPQEPQLETLRKQEEKRQQKAVRARQIAERQDVQIAHNMQYTDFNAAWDKYLEEYDR